MFHDRENVCDHAPRAGLFFGVVERDAADGAVCVASFMYESDARDYADYLATINRKVEVVDLLDLREGE